MNRGKTSKGKKQFYAELLTTSRDKNSKVQSFLEESPGVSVYEGQSKVKNLDDAIKEYVEPGMSLYVGEGANALEYGLVRQFHATNPGFVIISAAVLGVLPVLVHCGMVRKLITCGTGDLYPYPRPNPIIRREYKAGRLDVEMWSLCSIFQRLMASACGFPFASTRSIIGTTMAVENGDSFRVIEDPFGTGEKIGLAKALTPDLALVHAWAADSYGNTIIGPCLVTGDDSWGPRASKDGVVVTVEKIVSPEVIREHSHLVKIPGFMVKSVSLAPMGAHPQGMPIAYNMKGSQTYGEDYEFMATQGEAARDPEKMDAWAKEWIFDCRDHEGYLNKLGHQNVELLKRRGKKRSHRYKIAPVQEEKSGDARVSTRELMVIAAARKIEAIVLKNNYKILLAGMGITGLAVWLAYDKLKKKNHDIEILIGSGIYGISPPIGGLTWVDPNLLATCLMKTDVISSYAVIVGGLHSDKCLSVLGGASIDRRGNINSTKSSPDTFLVGSGGAADAANARDVVVVMALSRERFVDTVFHITCPGTRVRTIVTDMGIFERSSGEEDFSLTSYFPSSGLDVENILEEIRKNCWDFSVSPDLSAVFGPSSEELLELRSLDPKRLYLR